MRTTYYLLSSMLLIGSLTNCVAQRSIAPGIYSEWRPNTLFFASKEMRFYPDGKVAYFQYTDIVGHGKHAIGTYQLRGNTLELVFEGPVPMPEPRAVTRPLPAKSSGQYAVLTAAVDGVLGEPAQPLAFATVVLRDADGNVLNTVPCDSAGRALLPLQQTPTPHTVEVTLASLPAWKHAWPLPAAQYDIFLQPQLGSSFPGGTRFQYKLLEHTSDRMTLLQGRDTLALVTPAGRSR